MKGLSARIEALVFEVGGPREPRRTVLDVPALALDGGLVTAIVGPSGSGKSTLLYMLAGLLTPQRGAVAWAGVDLARLGEGARDRWRLTNAGFIFQSFNLVDELSPVDNVLLPSWFGPATVSDRHARAKALLERFGVPQQARRAAVLSRGEQQRVAIARALLLEPRVIFADEPTASLDAASGRIVSEELVALARKEGRTVITATHDPTLVEMADRVVYLERGKVVASLPDLVAV